ncbi:hypothetical protein [Pseudomonas deceptionensis]|uniref:Fimbrial protein n=1 Tax=Pseudomonas deceptionensis TaxID=882211 RepID=A0A0J6GEY4_PSEDM|nr:hypothetical protein [Pseudomonas deceptionensis]KMM80484.1 hypothetical protein TR67_11930 [Pseudomonas deceptionensis]SEE14891.1 hypothetical protein SAMN04489800_0053 [Pseudomonas deceptionensis]
MHNQRQKKPNRLLFGFGLLFFLILSIACPQAFAIEGSMECRGLGTGSATNFTNLGNLQPNESFRVSMSANCTAVRTFASGASLGQFNRYLVGSADDVAIFHTNSQKIVPLQQPGYVGPVCLPLTCTRLTAGTPFIYEVLVIGRTGSGFGRYELAVLLNTTMIGSPTYNEHLQSFDITYTVAKPGCKMVTNSTLDLPFGTLSSNDFATSQQIANITMNCPDASQVTASLSPTQSSTGAAGTSYTTLPQLLMVATWADYNSAVNFNVPRTFAFTAGTNTISLGFRPKLISPDATPSGNFSSQYTLNITYL